MTIRLRMAFIAVGAAAFLCLVNLGAMAEEPRISVTNLNSPSTVIAPTAQRCIRSFFDKMGILNSYSTRMEKTETVDGDTQSQMINVQDELKTHRITLTYLNRGHSGIKNNGMIVVFDGTPEIKMKLGQATGVSTLFRPLVSAVAGQSMKITDSNAIRGEVFTANRAGFAFLAQILRLHDKKNDFIWNDFKAETAERCDLEYRPKDLQYETISLKPTDDIFKIEDTYGQPAHLIYLDNKENIGSFQKLFDRSKEVQIRISKQFTAFDLKLDPETHLPQSFILYHQDKKIGTYQFSETELK